MPYTILVINPGSTSTKIGVFEDLAQVFTESVAHSADDLAPFHSVAAQLEFREVHIREALARRGFDLKRLDAIVGRGGLLRPIPSGVYAVDQHLLEDIKSARYGEHASNLGAMIADGLAKELGIPAFIADPVVVDELDDVARVCGHRLFTRISIFHALNHKAVARRYAKEKGLVYEDLTLIVVHLGGGVSVGLHKKGRVVDVNQALSGEGPFSPERAGTLPANQLAKLCFSGKYSEKEVLKMITGQGGFVSLLGVNDMRDVEKKVLAGDKEAALYQEAFIYNVGKAIGGQIAAARGKVDAIILTGGIAHQKSVVDGIKEMVGFAAPVAVYPGEGELEALALAGLRVLSGEALVQRY